MRQQDVISFFDRLAPQWDADMIRHDDIIPTFWTMPRWAPVRMCWT